MIENLDYDPSVDEESDYIHKDNLPDLDFAKEMLKSVKGAIYETGDIETLEDCLEELLATFDLKIPLHQPLLVKKESQMTNTLVTSKEKYSDEDISVIKNLINPSGMLNDEQISLFLYVCREKKLDPRTKQIYAVPRMNRKTGKADLTIQTSIDGFRLIAERTGKYSPGRPTVFLTDDQGELTGATVFVKKQTEDGTWHEVSATAFLKEYKPKYNNNFWDNMPSTMIEKVAETKALRRSFPENFSGIYSKDEMDQADTCETVTHKENVTTIKHITPQQAKELDALIGNDNKYRTSVLRVLKSVINKNSFEHMPLEMYEKVRKVALNNSEKTLEAKEA